MKNRTTQILYGYWNEVRIVDEAGKEVPRGTAGEIIVFGPNVMQGYWNQPELTAAAVRDGWMFTGDGGVMDDEGFVTVVDRLKDMIKSFAADGVAGVTQMRQHTRMPSLISGSITRANGEHISCDVLDISLDGVSLRTSIRPQVGEIINLGRTRGRVVRHHQDGIAVQYVREAGRAA